jgi:hypothetical protein
VSSANPVVGCTTADDQDVLLIHVLPASPDSRMSTFASNTWSSLAGSTHRRENTHS